MRKIFLYALAALVLTSCDNLKKKSSTTSDDEDTEVTKKKKKALDEEETSDEEETPIKKKKPVMDDEEVTTTDDTKDADYTEGWSNSQKNQFMSECVDKAKDNVGERRAKEYCSCFLNKVEARYSTYNEANSKMTQTELNGWAKACNE